MPYINLQITKGATREQKARIVAEFTETLVKVLGKKPENTHIVIQEIEREDWGHGGELVVNRQSSAAKPDPGKPDAGKA
jgi:4-oxalocrotonate tautomerase